MRDVTDKRTGELEVGEIKRGRGRPRKADAMTNAERQAAYRARRRAERVRPMDRPVYDPEALQDVAELEDDMAELRAELDATKAELAEAHETIDELQRRVCELLSEREKGAKRKSVTNNGNPISFSAMLDLLCLVSKARTKSDLQEIRETDLWRDQVVCSDADYEAVWTAVARERKVVTRKV